MSSGSNGSAALPGASWRTIAERFVTKGKQVFVEGRLQTRRFEDREGSPKTVTEVVVASLRVLGGAANAGRGRERSRRGGKRHDKRRE